MPHRRKGEPARAFDASDNHSSAGVGIQSVHDASDSQWERKRNNRPSGNQLPLTLDTLGTWSPLSLSFASKSGTTSLSEVHYAYRSHWSNRYARSPCRTGSPPGGS